MQGHHPKPRLSKDGSIHVTDEAWNTIIAGLGALLSIIGVYFLISRAAATRSHLELLGFSIYGFGLVNMFVSSALHHGVHGSPQTNHMLRQYDYYSISIMIAGSFTPFCLILLHNKLGWTMLGLIWLIACLGILLKAFFPHVPRWIMLSLFIAMGWMGTLIMKPLYQAVQWEGFFFLLLGGIFFTVGGLIFGLEKPNPLPGRFGFHEIWHCFVFAGTASHFYLIYHYL